MFWPIPHFYRCIHLSCTVALLFDQWCFWIFKIWEILRVTFVKNTSCFVNKYKYLRSNFMLRASIHKKYQKWSDKDSKKKWRITSLMQKSFIFHCCTQLYWHDLTKHFCQAKVMKVFCWPPYNYLEILNEILKLTVMVSGGH